MTIERLQAGDLNGVMALFCTCFAEDQYYSRLFPDAATRTQSMTEAFASGISYCINNGFCIGIKEGKQLIGFALCFDYRNAENDPEAFKKLFGARRFEKHLPYKDSLHGNISKLSGDILYCLSIAVDPSYQRKGLASCLIDHVLHSNPHCNLVSDVSNKNSLDIYRQRNFAVVDLDTDYYLVMHTCASAAHTFAADQTVNMLVPSTQMLQDHQIPFTTKKETVYLDGYETDSAYGISFFREAPGKLCTASVIELDYHQFLHFQRLINTAQYTECFWGNCLFYKQTVAYTCPPLLNDTLQEMILSRSTEWDIVPDFFVSVPVQCADRSLIDFNTNCQDPRTQLLLKNMDFRTYYEAGIPTSHAQVDDLASFKRRIHRIYLGKLQVQIASEATLDCYGVADSFIGPAVTVDVYLSLDKDSSCGVLTWYSLSAPFLLSHLMDNVIRNQLMVLQDGKHVNFFDYMCARYQILKRGTPKIFTVIPEEKNKLQPQQIASLLAGETIYPDGENFGSIIDEEILEAVNSETGMGQYDRAFVCAYSNVVLQFCADLKASLAQRIEEEAITLFYMELILFEEAAINIANHEIVTLFTVELTDDPVEFLSKVDAIYDDYSKTIAFWDIQVNYPTSKKSISMLRNAFRIHEQLEYMQRNQEQLRTAFETKCDIIDRRESRRMDSSLAIISVLAVFSAWMDGHTYIDTWTDVFSGSTIHILQRILFLAVLATAIYAVTHLCGGKIRAFWKKLRQKSKKRK